MKLKKIECITVIHNNLTRAKEPGPACLWQAGFAPIFLYRIHFIVYISVFRVDFEFGLKRIILIRKIS
ncbi:hypothetical protein LEP1GSC008_1433 [Leptospira kirschneri serovar Bulgarica str. Nikolaevo]|uniref:Uncharacterized protein n=1 Tax=Leptospira kirschneri serovar Bulgarica str. Nikolaevo TaxID=1240687 RepID=M6FSD9_9LEPT|nr:hypothetical protein LEP1GSC008_1433 [Leptospira kirschneri serovar Bulgarica str. Nikolaevo]